MSALVQRQRRTFLLLLLLCLYTMAWSQPKANFSATQASGCSPLVVYFSDSSSGSPTQWRWDLGNGVTSFQRNPSATYFNAGTYTIKLVVSNARGADSVVKQGFITVHANPRPAFIVDKTNGCFPLPVSFQSNSQPGSGTITQWQWDFGDGTVSNSQNPTHVYTAAGNFPVTLRVTNSFGCVASYTQPGAVEISAGVKAGFTNSDPGLCPVPATVQFTTTSTGPGPLKYRWVFGDGHTSDAENPSHVYRNKGIYSVSLVVTSPQGCVDTIRKDSVLPIGTARADYDYPATVCVNDNITFTNTSYPAPISAQWDFGDATSSTHLNPTKVFTRPGLFTVQLISNFGSCSDTVKKQVSVSSKPVADFTVTKQAFCDLPVQVQFSSLSTGNNFKYHWDFGDSTTATTAKPSHTYTGEGFYSVRLVVTNANGCSDTVTKKDFIRIQKPRTQVQGLPRYGCVPITITPTATMSNGQAIASYRWDFGDGSTSAAATPSHTYTRPGNYDVSLVVTTTDGCTDSITIFRGVRAGNKPKADFAHQPQTVCPYDRVFFTDKSTGGVDQWLWDFGDGGISTEQNPVHQFGDTGTHHVTLIAFNNTCADTIVVRRAVYVNPPVSVFSVQDDCNNKFVKQFTDRSLGPKSWIWEFGDGTTSTEQHPQHTYAAAGTYPVKLTVTNGNCLHYSIRTISVIDEEADFSLSDSVICRNGTISLSAKGINPANISGWLWDFGNGAAAKDAGKTSHRYTKAGSYNVTLTITDLIGCKSTKTLPLNVYGPTAAFTPSVGAACLKDNLVTFADASTTDGQHPVVKWIWNYGDNQPDSTSRAPFQHRYDSAGTYTVTLTVEDNVGCRDSRSQTAAVVIAQPLVAFAASDTLFCTGKRITFSNQSVASVPTYAWTFGDGGKSSFSNPNYAYNATGVYSVKLVVTDKYGCKDSVEKKNLITISYPKAAFTLSDSVGTCPPLLVHFANKSTDYKSISWDFGDNSSSRLDTPSHFYTTPGTFQAAIIATGYGGCTDTLRKTIVVKGPTGNFSYEPLTGCKPLTVRFKATTRNSASFIWDFSDGSTQTSSKDTTSYTYHIAGDFVPKMILVDAGGCRVPIEGKDTIRVKAVATDFAMNKTSFCDDGTVQFTNNTISNDYITGYQWSFGDGQTSTLLHPSHQYHKPGRYTVQLQVTTQNGCTDKLQLIDTIHVQASPVIQIEGDTAACAPATFTFNAKVQRGDTSLLNWQWNMANGQTATVQQPPSQQYAGDGSYTISAVATDDRGCSATATRRITVLPSPKTDAGADQWICRGSFYQLKATGASSYRWKVLPSLSCTDCDSPLAAPPDSTQYVVTGYNSFGCSRADSVTIRVHQPFTLTVAKGDTICAGKTVSLWADGARQYTWTPSLGVKNTTAAATTATPQTSTLYKVIAKDDVNCFTDTGYVSIKVWPMPTIVTETMQTLAVGNMLTLKPTYSADVTSYHWTNTQTLSCANCPWPVARPKTETTYGIEAKNDGGCSARESITVHVICNDGNLFIPNTFSPNTDGRNDRFYPRGTGVSSIKSLKVFNRWGQMVFSREDFNANDAAAGWDGTLKGAVLTPDVYIYTCEVVCMNNEVLTYRGDVTLLR